MNKALFKTHREKLFQQLLPNSVAIFYAGDEIKSTADQTYPFEINRNFYYLTGINQSQSILMIVKGENHSETFLFIEEFDEKKEKWTGKRLTPSEAKELSGIDNVTTLHNFHVKIKLILSSNSEHFGNIDNLYLDLEKDQVVGPNLMTTKDIKKSFARKFSAVKIIDAYPILVSLRLIKEDEEINELRKAIATTKIALDRIALMISQGLYEYHIVHAFTYEVGGIDNADLAFPTIAASGENATILHYPNATSRLKNGDLLLLDLGARHQHGFGADISRTFPISGKFTAQQAQIYDIVLQCNLAVIEKAKPGVTLLELQEFATSFLAGKCLSHGLITKKEDISKYYYHNVSHYLGLNVHDVGDKHLPLAKGMVITVEPGLYFKELGIGIRIEDDILITSDGAEVLSKDIGKTIVEIEKLMAK